MNKVLGLGSVHNQGGRERRSRLIACACLRHPSGCLALQSGNKYEELHSLLDCIEDDGDRKTLEDLDRVGFMTHLLDRGVDTVEEAHALVASGLLQRLVKKG